MVIMNEADPALGYQDRRAECAGYPQLRSPGRAPLSSVIFHLHKSGSMPGPVFLEGDRVTLHTVLAEDYEFVARHFPTPTMRHGGFEDIWTPVPPGDGGSMVEADDYHIFLACTDEKPVGSAFLVDVDLARRNAELGYWIIPDEHGNAYATDAADLCLTHAFDQLGLHKVWARTVSDNEASQRVLEKLGFQKEGVLREPGLDSTATSTSTDTGCWNLNDMRPVFTTFDASHHWEGR